MQHIDVEENQSEQANRDGNAGEGHGAPGGGDGRGDSLLDTAATREFFAEAADHEERIIDAETQAEERSDVQDEDGEGCKMSQAEDQSERDDNRASTNQRGQHGSDDRAEDEQQRDDGEGEGQGFRAPQIVFADGLDILVEDRAAANAGLEIRDSLQASLQFGQKRWRAIRVRLEQHIDIGGMAIDRNLARVIDKAEDGGYLRPRRYADQGRLGFLRKLRAIHRVPLAGEDDLYNRLIEVQVLR